MSLREQLRQILPEFLPTHAAEAIKGTDLIRLIRMKLEGDYSDATLRYHFSILSYDPTSPIAKVDQGQGYYQRQSRRPGAVGASLQGWFDQVDDAQATVWLRFDRVLAIYERVNLMRSSYPFVLNGRREGRPEIEGDWEVPDMVLAEWDLEGGDDAGERARLDQRMMRLRRHLGASEVTVTGVQVKLSTSHETHSADFFQALSASRWTERSELVIAESIPDESLVEALRSLGHQYGVGIVTLGLDTMRMDELPLPDEIRELEGRSLEALQYDLRIQRLTPASHRPGLDWTLLSRLRDQHRAIGDLVEWLGECLESGGPMWKRSKDA